MKYNKENSEVVRTMVRKWKLRLNFCGENPL